MADETLIKRFKDKIIASGAILTTILSLGTIGYWFIGEGRSSVIDCLYMTVITISTIGYGEIVDLSRSPGGRIFTMFIALTGIGSLTYILSTATAFVIEGDLTQAFRRRNMQREIAHIKDHYIVCGTGGVGFYVMNELFETRRPFVAIDIEQKNIDRVAAILGHVPFVEGDATDSDILRQAGVSRAKGLFSVTGDDNQNLVISLTAKDINSSIKVVSRCKEIKNMEKLKKAGADAVVKTAFIGGLRMASEMIRPTVVSFLDIMLRDKDRNVRIEEVPLSESHAGSHMSSLDLKKFPRTLILAVKTENGFIYNPPGDYRIGRGDVLIVMTTPEERESLTGIFSS